MSFAVFVNQGTSIMNNVDVTGKWILVSYTVKSFSLSERLDRIELIWSSFIPTFLFVALLPSSKFFLFLYQNQHPNFKTWYQSSEYESSVVA